MKPRLVTNVVRGELPDGEVVLSLEGGSEALIVNSVADAVLVLCDGSRTVQLPPGARIDVCRSRTPVRLARLSAWPFADRLVAKFDLSVTGWRGASRRNHGVSGTPEQP